MIKIYFVHTLGLVLVLEALRRSGAHPGSLFLAFIFNYFYRLLTLRAVLNASAGGQAPAWANLVVRPPAAGDKNEPIREGSPSGPAAPIYAYFLTILVTGYMGFILTHSVNSSRLDVTWGQTGAEMLSAAWLALIWWVQDLAGGSLVADTRQDLTYNLGFNSHEASICMFTVLTGAAVLVAGEVMGFSRNPWMTVGPLLFYKWVWGIWADKRHFVAGTAPAEAKVH